MEPQRFKIPRPASCPICEQATSELDAIWMDRPPQEGDLSVCGFCGEFLVFTVNLDFARASDADLDWRLVPALLQARQLIYLRRYRSNANPNN